MVNILNIPLYDKGLDHAVDHVIDACRNADRKNSECISASDAHVLITAKQNVEFGNVLRSFYLNLPDGMPSVWIGKLKGRKTMERCYGPDFFLEVIRKSSNLDLRHYLCGGKEHIAENLKLVCEKKYSNFNIVGVYEPPFRDLTEEELKALARDINVKGTDILWMGLSSPKQHYLAVRLRALVHVHFIVTVGAAFDFHTKNVRQAPAFLQKLGMEWFFRLSMEPKRLWKRYVTVVPFFIYYNVVELLQGKFFNDKAEEIKAL